ncbi:MAG: TM0106 family RecB-like putative nuclease [Candidatus Rokubacteria bacterium]|nr:TM0106 family RecB-like putative nuclease [Candidatus Rokubacteria bacterium]
MRVIDGRLFLTPTDLNDHVECAHLTTLKLEVARETRKHPYVAAEYSELLRGKGDAHERAYLAKLRADGRDVRDVIPTPDKWDFGAGARLTEAAMRAGAEIIYQATFVVGDWRGRADFLERIDTPSALGAWSYEPVDAKLARAEKPTYLLQLCFYAEGIAAVQGARPERLHVLLGDGARRTLRHDDFAAYFRRVRQSFEAAIGGAATTEPYPVEHCGLCDFRGVCNERWDAEDHLSLVAGIRRAHVEDLRDKGVTTLTQLAGRPAGAPDDPLDKLRDQAHLQLLKRKTGKLEWHVIDGAPDRGFALLPAPSAGDVIFDIEGDPFWEPARGLHFLWGVLDAGGYQPIWAHTREEERVAFERVIDLIHERLARHPDMHVYHYGAYETTAIKQLMGAYGTREDAVDDLLRRKVFVDLYTVVRQGLRAGVPSYSLKETEALAAFKRAAGVTSGTLAVLAYEQWMARGGDGLAKIAAYNEEDCRATGALRDWLVAHRPEDVAPLKLLDVEVRDEPESPLRAQLLAGATPGSLRWMAGELLEYHRREAKPVWWWFFQRCEQMTLDDLVEDAESIARLDPVGSARRSGRSWEQTYRFPPQEFKLGAGDRPTDPATKKDAGLIVALDEAKGTLVLRRGEKTPSPAALIPGGPYRTTEQRRALERFAGSVLADDGGYPALRNIVERGTPRLSPPRAVVQATDIGELRALAASLDGGALFVQGPPGTGKTWTGARLIVELMRQGRRVGVAATSHKAIHNLLDAVEEAAAEEAFAFRGVKKATLSERETLYDGASFTNVGKVAEVAASRVPLVAGTAWLFAHGDMDGTLDTLVIDEAGQVSLADALAMGCSARNVILLGDPLQLAQVSQGTHPEGAGVSVLEHLLDADATIPKERGVFLDRTRRMHPDVCRFVSEIVYDGRLSWTDAVAVQATAFGTGLRWVPVEHVGRQVASSEEADRVASLIASMRGAAWTNADGVTAALGDADFMVVAPYNAQVRRLRAELDRAGLRGVQAGTVDKFQGREAAVVFYSMATSSAEDVPRSLEFLFSRNRLNVAVSRAKCLAYVVASPRLLESRARTVEQMRLINALCRFVELAAASPALRVRGEDVGPNSGSN